MSTPSNAPELSVQQSLESILSKLETLTEIVTNHENLLQNRNGGTTSEETLTAAPRGDQRGPKQAELAATTGLSSEIQHGIRASDSTGTVGGGLFKHEAYKAVFKLEGAKDYHIWSFTMMKFLEGEGLSQFVLGMFKKPELRGVPGSTEFNGAMELYKQWSEGNTAAERAIMSCIGKTQISLLTRCQSAAEMWERLRKTYLQDDDSNILRLEAELQTVSWKKNTTVDSYIKSIDDLADQLRACGQEVSDRNLKLHLLKGLPEKFEYIKHILLQSDSTSYQSLCDKLRSHVGLSKLSEAGSSSSSAYMGSGKEKGKKNGKPCTHCKRTNHKSEDCFFKEKKSKDLKDVKCYKCGKPGHYAKDCEEEESKGDNNEEKKAMSAFKAKEKTNQGAAHTARLNRSKIPWIVDSGATHHMCADGGAFTNQREVTGLQKIQLGDASTLTVEKEGNVELDMLHTKKKTVACELHGVLNVPGLSRNLFSVTSCLQQGNDVSFEAEKMICKITKRGELLATAHLRDGLWVLNCKPPKKAQAFVAVATMEPDQTELVVTEAEEEKLEKEASREKVPESPRILITKSPRVKIQEVPKKVPEVSGRMKLEHQVALDPSGDEDSKEHTREEEEPVHPVEQEEEEEENDIFHDVIIVREEQVTLPQLRDKTAPSKLTYTRLGGVNQGAINYDAYVADAEVEDLVLATRSLPSVNSVKSALSPKFKMTEAGEIKTVLGIVVARDREKGVLTLSQERCAQEILKKFRMPNCEPKDTPLKKDLKLTSEMSPQTQEEFLNMENVTYRQAVGNLMYLGEHTT